jgi:AhpD family alkylhydroperoxidase
MEKRINIKELEPRAYEAIFELEKYLNGSSLDKIIKELIKVRASQINGCAYCIELHTQVALKNGETQKRLFALSAWRESNLFTSKEKAVLQMTEEISLISQAGLTSKTYNNSKEYFPDKEIAEIIMQIGTINLWNRIAVSTCLVHEK